MFSGRMKKEHWPGLSYQKLKKTLIKPYLKIVEITINSDFKGSTQRQHLIFF